MRVPAALREFNGGNPWASSNVADALNIGARSANFFYITTAARAYGLTEGTRDSAQISLTALGRRVVYPSSPAEEVQARLDAFLSADLFKRVLHHFGGNNLPEPRFLANTLATTFGIPEEHQDEFADIFAKNCRFLGIGKVFRGDVEVAGRKPGPRDPGLADSPSTVTVATPEQDGNAPVCFVIMPFSERDDSHEPGFFDEVLSQIFTPAASRAGFRVTTAKRQGSDIIQSTIVNDLLQADLVLADLTEHNPNVLFELGMRMAEDQPVALVRARGTGPIFDVDNMLRVAEYSPNVWPSTVAEDVKTIEEHIRGTWAGRETGPSFMKLLRQR